MLKKFLNIISNPILYYTDKSGNSVFRNYCVFRNNGCLYQGRFAKKDIGKALEYRFGLDKFLRRTYIFTTIILYLILIHLGVTILNILFAEFMWLFVVLGTRIICSKLYNIYLERLFGPYELITFTPPVSKAKMKYYRQIFVGRAVAICILVGLFFLPSLVFQNSIEACIVKKQKYSSAVKLSKIYSAIYPPSTKVYDYTAIAKFKLEDYTGALADYKKSQNLSGKKFVKQDIVRLGNMMYIQKGITNATEAVDLFNEYSTKKNTTIDDNSQLLWVKSIFKIENNIVDGIAYDYDNLLASVAENDIKTRFYIMCDKAYISYLAGDYVAAVDIYDTLIEQAENNKTVFSKELMNLYAERGFAKHKLSDYVGADEDFSASQISRWDLTKYEPKYEKQVFIETYK